MLTQITQARIRGGYSKESAIVICREGIRASTKAPRTFLSKTGLLFEIEPISLTTFWTTRSRLPATSATLAPPHEFLCTPATNTLCALERGAIFGDEVVRLVVGSTRGANVVPSSFARSVQRSVRQHRHPSRRLTLMNCGVGIGVRGPRQGRQVMRRAILTPLRRGGGTGRRTGLKIL